MTSTLGSRSGARKGRALSPAFLKRQWKPGQSGNPSGHTAEYGEVNKLARQYSVRAMERLGELMESQDERVATVACSAILDRAHGKPETRQPEPVDDFVAKLGRMTPEQRMELARDMAVRLKEQVARYREIEGQASEVAPDESEHQGSCA